MPHASIRPIGLLLVAAMTHGAPLVAVQTEPYPVMAPIDQYLMDADAEIRLARSAAPESISRHATVLVLRRHGYETAVEGTNGFVCWVGRGWMAAFDWPEFWNPKVRAADCMNAQAARFIVPVAGVRSRAVMAGRSKAEIVAAVKAAFSGADPPTLASGAMHYMMSKSAYLTDEGEHNAPHLMFPAIGIAGGDWGANMPGSPVMAAPYWFFASKDPTDERGLPSVQVFLVGLAHWSDGTIAKVTR